MDIVCFGCSVFGQLDSNKFDFIRKRLPAANDQKIISVSFTWNKCYILLENGTLTVFGFIDNKPSNTKTYKLPSENVIKFTCSNNHQLCLTGDGSCWKCTNEEWVNITKLLNVTNNDNQEELKLTNICCSDVIHLALSANNLIFNIPLQIETPPKIKINDICCGLEHSLCLTDTGSIYIWGNGSRGQLGNGSLNLVEKPELLTVLDGIPVTRISAGGWHSAAVTVCGDLYTWGWNNVGQLAFRNNKDAPVQSEDTCTMLTVPTCVPLSEDDLVKRVSCGMQHTLILLENGLVYGCGWNKYGQINPHDKTEYFDYMTSVPVPENIDAVHDIYCEAWNSALFVTTKE